VLVFRSFVKAAGKVVLADVGMTRQEIHEARQIRDAEKRAPGASDNLSERDTSPADRDSPQ